MRHKRLKLSAVLLLGLGLTGLQAQTSVNATGTNASGSGGTVSYSVGQVVYTTNTGASGSVAQCVQQPFEISIVTGIEEAKGINLSVSAYPNPTTDDLIIETHYNASQSDAVQYSASLYDIQGKLLKETTIVGNQGHLTMSNLAPSTYYVKVWSKRAAGAKKEVKTFKIIKKYRFTSINYES